MSAVKFYCGLNLDLGFGVGKQSHTKYTHTKKDIADARMPECTLGSNWTEKQTDPGVHSLYFTCLITKKTVKPFMHVKRPLNLYLTIPNLKDLAEEDLRKNCVNQHFLHILQCFQPLTGIVVICVTLISSVGTYKDNVQVWTENGSSRFQISTNLSKT